MTKQSSRLHFVFAYLFLFTLFIAPISSYTYDQFWSVKIKSSSQVEVKAVVSDKDNNLWVCGHYNGNADFYSSSQLSPLTAPHSFHSGSSLGWRLFIALYDILGNPKKIFFTSEMTTIDTYCSSIQSTSNGIHFLAKAVGEGVMTVVGSTYCPKITISNNAVILGKIENNRIDLKVIASSPFELTTHGLVAIEGAQPSKVDLVAMVAFTKALQLQNKTQPFSTFELPSGHSQDTFNYTIRTTLNSSIALILANANGDLSITSAQPSKPLKNSNTRLLPGDMKGIVRKGVIHILFSGSVDGDAINLRIKPIGRDSKTILLDSGTFLGFLAFKTESGKANFTRLISSPVLQLPIGLIPHPSSNSHFSFFFAVVTKSGDTNKIEVGQYDVRTSKHVVVASLEMEGNMVLNHVILDDDKNIWLGGIQNGELFGLRFDKKKENLYVNTADERKKISATAIDGGYIALHVPTGISFDLVGRYKDDSIFGGEFVGLTHSSLRVDTPYYQYNDEDEDFQKTKEKPGKLNGLDLSATWAEHDRAKSQAEIVQNQKHGTQPPPYMQGSVVVVIVAVIVAAAMLFFILIVRAKQTPRVYRFSPQDNRD